jgi:hypothetical protein
MAVVVSYEECPACKQRTYEVESFEAIIKIDGKVVGDAVVASACRNPECSMHIAR